MSQFSFLTLSSVIDEKHVLLLNLGTKLTRVWACLAASVEFPKQHAVLGSLVVLCNVLC